MRKFRSMVALIQDLPEERREALLNDRVRVTLPPGYRMTTVLSAVLTRRAFERLVEPVILDMHSSKHRSINYLRAPSTTSIRPIRITR
jgi:hypothetical protein